MSIAEDASGTEVWIRMEWEQIDAIVVKELENHIEMVTKEIQAAKNGEGWVHPEDFKQNLKLLPALLLIYEYWAGEEAAVRLKKEIGYED